LPVDSVNTGFSGSGRTFQITYTAEAQTGPISVTRQVLVEDTQAPIIEPTFLQFDPVSVRPYGYRDFDVDWNYYPESFYVHDVNCNANWQMIDSGTAWDTCGEGTPTDYWDDVEVTVRPLVGNYIPEQDDEGNDIFVPVEEFTQHPGRYRLDYTVRDAAGNESTYTSDPYFRYVRVMDTTPVPVVALSGYTREEAEERVSAAHLIPVVTEEYHAWINAGAIFSQDPAAGVFVSCGTEVHFSISLGPGDCIFPEIFGMQIEDAKAALIDAGFVVGNVNYEDSDATAGTVLDYQGNTLVCGAIIDLTVAAEKCVMPAIDTGASPDDAIAQIVDAGFAEPEVIFEWHTYPANTLFGQFPVPGEQLCNTPSKIYFSLGLIPVEIILSAVWENNIECNTVWVDPGAIVSAGSDIVEPVAIIQAAEIAYKDGDDWIAVASDTPLHTDFSPYRITYRYEYQQPDTEELGVLETEYLLNVTDMEYPEVTVDESPDSFKEINDIDYPYYLFAKGQYGHWNEVEQDRGITVSAWDLCDGDIPQDNIDLLILYLDADLDENTDKGEYDDDDSLPVMSLEELGLTEDTWLSAPGIYIVVYIAVDEAKNDAGSIRLVQVADPAEAI
ncbi:MAG: hypothetical protein GX130_00615, partial [Candidatus Hydrogenedens sp.]|nr:hypothetical protein [Candidatus Hydrogenedens sp.]